MLYDFSILSQLIKVMAVHFQYYLTFKQVEPQFLDLFSLSIKVSEIYEKVNENKFWPSKVTSGHLLLPVPF